MVRLSSGLYLEVLTARPQAGVPLAISMWDGANPGTMLAELQGASGITFQHVLSDVGSGSFRIAVDDPKATLANIREGNLVKVRLNDVDVFPFWIESPKLVISESGKSEWQLGGSGGLQVLAQGVAYPPGWPTPTGTERVWTTATAGLILKTLIDEAQGRGALPHITYDFDATVDSQNNPWPADLELTTHAGTTILDVAKQLAALGITILMTPQLVFRAYVSGTFGRDLSTSVVWRYGRHIAGDVTRVGIRSVLQDAVLVEGSGGKFIEINDPTVIADAYTGRREGGLAFTSSADPTTLQNAGQAQMAITQADAAAISVPLDHGTGNGLYSPYADYQPGDWVSLDIPGQYAMAKLQLKALTLTQTDAADYTTTADLNAVALDYLVRLRNMLASASGTASGASGGASGSLGLGAPVSPGTPLTANTPAASAPGDTGAVGVGSGAARDDHKHGREAWGLAADIGPETFGASAAAGATGKDADAGHVHPMPSAVGGDLSGALPNPTVAATHSGSSHATTQAAAEATAAGALSSHAGAADPHTGYQKESEKGAASGYAGLGAGGLVPIAQLASGTPDGTKYVRDDGTLATPAGGGGGVSLGSATPLVESGSGAVGTSGNASHDDHVHPAAGGGSGATIVRHALTPATPTDDFNATLSGWTAVSTAGSFDLSGVFAQADNGSKLWLPFGGQHGYIYLPTTNVDQEWQVGNMIAGPRTADMFFGIAILDTSSNGVGMIYHSGDNTCAIISIAAGLYTGSPAAQITSPYLGWAVGSGSPIWLRLTRVGNTWDAYASVTGHGWEAHVAATMSKTITAARKCIGIFSGSAFAAHCSIMADWVHSV